MKRLIEFRSTNSLILTSVTDRNNKLLCASMLLQDKSSSQRYGLYGVSARYANKDKVKRILVARAKNIYNGKRFY